MRGGGGWRFGLFAVVLACSSPSPSVPPGTWANVGPARVEAVLHGEGRAYLRVAEGPFTFWASVPDLKVSPGDFVLLGKGPLAYGVRSGEANRLFDAITLIEEVAVVDEATANAAIKLDPVEGGLDVATVYARRRELSGTGVIVRGRVVKAAKNVQGTNWYHLADGTRGPGDDEGDLTVTSAADLSVGQVVVATGPLTIDQDLGFGYFYAALIEGATVVEDTLP